MRRRRGGGGDTGVRVGEGEGENGPSRRAADRQRRDSFAAAGRPDGLTAEKEALQRPGERAQVEGPLRHHGRTLLQLGTAADFHPDGGGVYQEHMDGLWDANEATVRHQRNVAANEHGDDRSKLDRILVLLHRRVVRVRATTHSFATPLTALHSSPHHTPPLPLPPFSLSPTSSRRRPKGRARGRQAPGHLHLGPHLFGPTGGL